MEGITDSGLHLLETRYPKPSSGEGLTPDGNTDPESSRGLIVLSEVLNFSTRTEYWHCACNRSKEHDAEDVIRDVNICIGVDR